MEKYLAQPRYKENVPDFADFPWEALLFMQVDGRWYEKKGRGLGGGKKKGTKISM